MGSFTVDNFKPLNLSSEHITNNLVRLSIANFNVVDINVLLQITEDPWETNHIVSNLEQYLIADLRGLEPKSYQNVSK